MAATNTAAQLVRAVGLTLRRSSLVRRASLRHAATTVATWVREVEVVVVGATQRSSELEACCLFSFVPLYRGRTLSSCLTVAAQRPFIVSYTVHFGLGVCRLFDDAHRSQCACVYFVLLGASMAACFHSLGRCTELPLLLHYLGLLALIVVAALRASFVCTLCVRMSLPFGKCVFTYTHILFPCVCIFPPVGRYHVSLSDSNQFLKHRCRISFPHVRVCCAPDNTYACT